MPRRICTDGRTKGVSVVGLEFEQRGLRALIRILQHRLGKATGGRVDLGSDTKRIGKQPRSVGRDPYDLDIYNLYQLLTRNFLSIGLLILYGDIPHRSLSALRGMEIIIYLKFRLLRLFHCRQSGAHTSWKILS